MSSRWNLEFEGGQADDCQIESQKEEVREKTAQHNTNLCSAPWHDITPSSTDASRQPTRCRWNGSLEITDEGGIENKAAGHPGVILRTIPLPVDEVLHSTPRKPGIHNPMNVDGGVAVDFPGGLRGTGWRAQRTGVDRFDLGDTENGMTEKMGRELEANREWTDHGGYFEWAEEHGASFLE
ncbi:hypothetical protein CRENBAI_019263 [Crenichthys baileyi]|uniref:Uncharacterized protein n=1 Tax=Crenichthys baileyi TaxID=28760 RepID=A0AAV9RQM0_9TELE